MPTPDVAPSPVTREIDLILYLARAQVTPDVASRARALVAGGIDWRLLLRMAKPHGVLPLVYLNLQTLCPGELPPGLDQALHQQVRALTRSNVVRAGYLVRLVQAFDAASIDVIPFKGPILLAQVYRDMSHRPFGDLDLLVRPKDVARVRKLLLDMGFRAGGSEAWEWEFVDPSGTITVDLHDRIASTYFPEPGTFDELWRRRRPVTVCGAPLAAMAPEDLLLSLAVQWAKDCREWKQRLVQICDGAELLRAYPDLDWRQVVSRARHRGGERILHLYLYLVRMVLDADLPPPLWDAVRRDTTAAALAAEVRGRMFAEAQGLPDVARFRSEIYREDSAFHLRSRERVRDKLDYLWRYGWVHLGLLVRPTGRDRAFIRLPERLGLLYYVVRPLRVANDLVGRKARATTERGHSGPPPPQLAG